MANPRIPYQLSIERPRLPVPMVGGKRRPLIVHIVVNVEHWPFDQPMPRKIITPPGGAETLPDVPNFSWVDYGMRCGLPRIMEALVERKLTATTSFNAGVADVYPQAADAMLKLGWEFMGHGLQQRTLNTATDEGEVIKACLDKIQGLTGKKVRGWLSPGLRETFDTPDHLAACGVEYVCDWVIDDLPSWMTTRHGRLLAMPYSLELNDSVAFAVEHHSSGEIYQRLVDTLATFDRGELAAGPKVLTLPLHPHLSGVPHRMVYLRRILDLLVRREDAVFLQGSQITDWFVSAGG